MLLWNLPSPIVGPSPKDFASSLKFSPLYLGSQKPEECYGWGKEKGRGRGGEGRKKKIKKERRKGMEWKSSISVLQAELTYGEILLPTPLIDIFLKFS